MWVQAKSIVKSNAPSDWKIRDVWEFKDGDFCTITNRPCDVPEWMELHPTEVAGAFLTQEYLEKLNRGEYPSEPLQAANIWRVPAGVRLLWLHSTDHAGMLNAEIMDLRSCALVIGENTTSEFDTLITYGAPSERGASEAVIKLTQRAFQAIVELGIPRCSTAGDWRLGG